MSTAQSAIFRSMFARQTKIPQRIVQTLIRLELQHVRLEIFWEVAIEQK